MRAAAVALLLALAIGVSDSALARKGGGGQVSSGGGKFSGGKVHGGQVSSGGGKFKGHHHGAAFVGFGVGFAYPWSWYYPPPYYYPGYYYPSYYYPQPVVYPAQPVTYVEQGAAPAPAEPAGWWYYCEASRTYYPYVKECPSGWQRVPALPPPPN